MEKNQKPWIRIFIALAITIGLALLILQFGLKTQYSHQQLVDHDVTALADFDWQSHGASNAQWHKHQIAPYQSLVITSLTSEPVTLIKSDPMLTEIIKIEASSWQKPLQTTYINSLSRPVDLYHSVDHYGRVFFGSLPNPILFMLLGALVLGQLALWLLSTMYWRPMAAVVIASPLLMFIPVLPPLFCGALLISAAVIPINKKWFAPWASVAIAIGFALPEQWQAWSAFIFAVPVLCFQLANRYAHWYQQVSWLALVVIAAELPVRSDVSIVYSLAAVAIWQLCQMLGPMVQLANHSAKLERSHRGRGYNNENPQLDNLKQQIDSLQSKNRLLHEKTWVDALTGLRNRLFFNEHYQSEVARSGRERTPLSLLILDLDFFKAINDTHGHPAGDEVLRQVAKRLYYSLRRPADALCRIGGEEFAVLLPQTGRQGALHVAQTLLSSIAEKPIVYEDIELKVTASVGCATIVQQSSLKEIELFNRADAALYEAKRNGRNRVECSTTESEIEHFAIKEG